MAPRWSTTPAASVTSRRSVSTRPCSPGSTMARPELVDIGDVRRGPRRGRGPLVQRGPATGWPGGTRPGSTPLRGRCWTCRDRGACATTMLPDAVQVADPFHLVKLANTRLDEVRRRVQHETLGHRGHKADPLYRSRRLLTKASERLDDKGNTKLMGLLEAGDPRGEVRWLARQEVVRSVYDTPTQNWLSSSSPNSASISKTPRVRPRSASSAAPSPSGAPRSRRGTKPTSPTGRPRQRTT